ncbi:integrase catalytic domain-containing protein [Trichonephila clavipes]|nr:integrase catalytic domain-containing protein [Trichonephila clavipes]
MQDLTPITPARFLFEKPTADTKDLDVRDANHFPKRLRFRAKVIEELKRRFRNEYVGQIQRQKQHPQSSNLQVSDIVLIGDDWKKCLQWPLARVIKLIPGKDGLFKQTDSSVSYPNPDTLKTTEKPQVTRCGRPVKKPDKLKLLALRPTVMFSKTTFIQQMALFATRRQSDNVCKKILLKKDKWLKRRKFNDDNSDNDNVRDQVNEPTPGTIKDFEKQVCVSEKAQVASDEIAELIAVNLKPHNLAEEIILPACRKIVKTMIDGSADIDICKIPLSNDTIHRRIKDMSGNIEQNTAKTLANSNFALQVDETTDITGNAQLIAFLDEATDSNKDAHFIAYVRFGDEVDDEFSELKTKAFRILLPFSTPYLCETGFSAEAALKTRYRSQLNIEKELLECQFLILSLHFKTFALQDKPMEVTNNN